ncbi:MAG: tetratricopeptide repeat protein, partial [Candidatus Latescibacteria bacterium]|nr:tetratricopeptide repeat protein [Candidatus Latescibacterota bacterium]
LRQAIAVYGRLLADYPAAAQIHPARYRLARLRFAAGRAEEAQQLLGQIIAADPAPPAAPSALLLAGRIDLFLGNREAAEMRFKTLARRFPTAAQTDSARLDRADHLYSLRLYSQAGDAYRRAFDKIRDQTLGESALLGLADARRQSQQTREALDHYQALIAGLEPGHPAYLKARLGQAIALGQAGQFALAVGMFQGLIQIGETPESRDALRELGALYKRRGDHSRSITWYRRYLQETDDAADAVRFELGELYASTGYFEEAIELYRALASDQNPVAARAQFGLAQVFEQSAQPRAALREYIAYLELFPAARQGEAARERIEYLREFTVMDVAGLNRALQKAWIDELSGTPRQLAQLGVARVLFEHHDFAAAAKSFEHYAAAYPNDHYSGEAQYYLAESLLKLARQRQLESRPVRADSLRTLALKEYRILANADEGAWGQRARIRLIETEAESGADSLRLATLEAGFADFVATFAASGSDQLDQALLQLADARRLLAANGDSTQLA